MRSIQVFILPIVIELIGIYSRIILRVVTAFIRPIHCNELRIVMTNNSVNKSLSNYSNE